MCENAETDISTISGTGVMPSNEDSVDTWVNSLCRYRQRQTRDTNKKQKFLEYDSKITGDNNDDASRNEPCCLPELYG